MAEQGISASTKVLGAFLRLHQFLYERTDGRVGHHMSGRTFLLLRTVGAKTGKRRVSALLYIRDGERYAVVASKGGGPRHPGWYHNLMAGTGAEIQVGRRRIPVRAGEAEGDERARLWTAADRVNRGTYTGYERRTDRRIPVVVLEPIAEG